MCYLYFLLRILLLRVKIQIPVNEPEKMLYFFMHRTKRIAFMVCNELAGGQNFL